MHFHAYKERKVAGVDRVGPFETRRLWSWHHHGWTVLWYQERGYVGTIHSHSSLYREVVWHTQKQPCMYRYYRWISRCGTTRSATRDDTRDMDFVYAPPPLTLTAHTAPLGLSFLPPPLVTRWDIYIYVCICIYATWTKTRREKIKSLDARRLYEDI